MAAAVDERRELDSRLGRAHVERADALGPVHFVRGQRQQIDAHGLDVERNLTDALGRVSVKQNIFLFRQPADLFNRVDRADLVVRRHERDKNRLVGQRFFELLHIDQTVRANRQIGYVKAMLLQNFAAVQDRFMLGHTGDDVIAFVPISIGNAFDRQIVRLRRTAGNNDLLCRRADQFGDLLPRRIDSGLRFPAERVAFARRIAKALGEIGQHRFQHPWIDGRGGVIIQIYRCLYGHGKPAFQITDLISLISK